MIDKEMKWTVFGERLSKELEKKQLSYRQFAERTGMTTTTVCRYAKCERVPRASEIIKTAEALGVTCDYLLGLSDDPHKTSMSYVIAQPERKTGKWIEGGIYRDVIECYCSECGQIMTTVATVRMNYCPNCGARMRGEQNATD